jgi:hypothetical protein
MGGDKTKNAFRLTLFLGFLALPGNAMLKMHSVCGLRAWPKAWLEQ